LYSRESKKSLDRASVNTLVKLGSIFRLEGAELKLEKSCALEREEKGKELNESIIKIKKEKERKLEKSKYER